MSTAPKDGAARSQPRPTAPTWRICSAKIGQQRRRAAEQHGEQIERDRGEDDLVAADEAQAGEEIAQRMRMRARRSPAGRGSAA